jgi:hypothetical protein
MKDKILKLMKWILKGSNSTIVSYQQNPQVMKRIHAITKDVGMLLSINEAYQIYKVVVNTSKVEGDIAEVGTYTGGSARLIGENKGGRKLYIFDTFEGLPDVHEKDGSTGFYKTQFSEASLETVKEYLKGIPNVFVYKGLFPGTSEPIKDKRFSVVHLDVDLYQGTKDSLEFFYPRMNKGAVLISHDYVGHEGVHKAFDEFLADKPEPVIEMSGSQALFVKC